MLLPALSKARAKAQAITCRFNLKSLGYAAALYGMDFDNFIPYGYDQAGTPYQGFCTAKNYGWTQRLAPYVRFKVYSYWQITHLTATTASKFPPKHSYQCPSMEKSKGEIGFSANWITGNKAPVCSTNSTLQNGQYGHVKKPSQRAFLLDMGGTDVNFFNNAIASNYADRHAGGTNMLMFDNSVPWALKATLLVYKDLWYSSDPNAVMATYR